MSCNGQVEYLTPPSPISPDILPKDKDPQQDTLTAFKRADGSLNAHIPHAHSSFEALPTPKPKAKPKRNNHKPRKQSRKTAHSVIERRRRDKMNAQFDVLKDMVPTCRGAEKGMHKSAILQAGIEHIRYLEERITALSLLQMSKCFGDGSQVPSIYDLTTPDVNAQHRQQLRSTTPDLRHPFSGQAPQQLDTAQTIAAEPLWLPRSYVDLAEDKETAETLSHSEMTNEAMGGERKVEDETTDEPWRKREGIHICDLLS